MERGPEREKKTDKAQRPVRTQTEGHSRGTKGHNQKTDPRLQDWRLFPEAFGKPRHTKQPEARSPGLGNAHSPSLPLTKAPRHRASQSRRGRRWPG